MHFHLPKPLHGWREFVGEIAIIVVGVMIALGAEQVVEDWHWRKQVDKEIDALRDEVGGHYFQSAEAVISAPCIDRQLEALEAAVLKPGAYVPAALYKDGVLQFTYRAPLRNWGDPNWQSILAEGGASHLRRDLRLALGGHYAQMESMRQEAKETERLQWSLRALALPIQPDAAARVHLVEEIEQARGTYSLVALGGNQVVQRIDDIGLQPLAKELHDSLRQSGTLKFCREHQLPLAKLEHRH